MDKAILQHKERIKNLEETSRKYSELRVEYESLKKSAGVGESRKTDSSLETNRRRLINKYYV